MESSYKLRVIQESVLTGFKGKQSPVTCQSGDGGDGCNSYWVVQQHWTPHSDNIANQFGSCFVSMLHGAYHALCLRDTGAA